MKKLIYLFLFLTTAAFCQTKFQKIDSLLTFLNQNNYSNYTLQPSNVL